jgi:hypothetical protein
VVGTLQVTDPGKCCLGPCGTAEQGPATACLSSDTTSLLTINVEPAGAMCGQELAINNREGPVERPAAVGHYRLAGSFRIGVTQGKGCCG